ncbi:hypothetical protein ID0457_10590 [Helicobacter pylori]
MIDDKNNKLESCFYNYKNSRFFYFPIITNSQITSLSLNELPQFLANFKFSKSSNGIDKAEFSLSSLSLENMTPY